MRRRGPGRAGPGRDAEELSRWPWEPARIAPASAADCTIVSETGSDEDPADDAAARVQVLAERRAAWGCAVDPAHNGSGQPW